MKVIYVMDPLCGWCYGNEDNVLKLYEKYKSTVDFEVIPGGMWAGDNVRKQSPQMVNYFMRHDEAIAKKTGATFGTAYMELLKKELVLDSEIPSRAIVAVQKIAPAQSIPFMVAVQKARYYNGKDLNLTATYLPLCDGLGISQAAFLEAFGSEAVRQSTLQTFRKATQYAQAYPTMLVEKNGALTVIEQGYAPLNTLEESIDALKK
ncbi:DsbA family protein [Flexibacter flexilis]|nr:DsbA family protein [Flexibacter flexilis]